MPNKIIIRDADRADLDVLVRYNVAMAAETENLQLDTGTVIEGALAVLDDPAKGRFYLATVDERVVGQLLVTFEWSDWRNGMFLWIQSVYVEPAHRQTGVFKALYAHVARQAKQPGYCGVRLYVSQENPAAIQTYERLGMIAPGYVVMETPDELRRDS